MGGSSLGNIADDLLFLLAERIGAVTFIRFSVVCKSWHFVASATKCCKLIPWLMMIEKDGSELRDFYDHSTGELYQFSLPQAQRVKNLGFANGWLITAEEDCSFHLVNPLSGIKISLPAATFIRDDDDNNEDDSYDSEDNFDLDLALLEDRNLAPIKATCSPIRSDGDGIVALTYRGMNLSFAFCRLSGQRWILIKDSLSCEVAFIDGVFYTVSIMGEISILDFTSSPLLIKIADLPMEMIDSNACGFINCHMVECGGAILIGVKIYASTISGGSVLADIRLFKLDKEGKKVVNLESIGNYALFFGSNDAFSLAIPSEEGFFRRNCIYFTNVDEFTNFDDDGKVEVGEDIIVYNIEDKSFTTHSVGGSKSSYSYPIWVCGVDLRNKQNSTLATFKYTDFITATASGNVVGESGPLNFHTFSEDQSSCLYLVPWFLISILIISSEGNEKILDADYSHHLYGKLADNYTTETLRFERCINSIA